MNTESAKEVVASACTGMLNDVKFCLINEHGGWREEAPWIGVILLIFCYIEQLGHLFLGHRKSDWKYTKAFLEVYMSVLSDAVKGFYQKSQNPYSDFNDDFRNGLVHQYFPKKGHLINIVSKVKVGVGLREVGIISKHPSDDDVICIDTEKLFLAFEDGIVLFQRDVEQESTRTYLGQEIKVVDKCKLALEEWLPEEPSEN